MRHACKLQDELRGKQHLRNWCRTSVVYEGQQLLRHDDRQIPREKRG